MMLNDHVIKKILDQTVDHFKNRKNIKEVKKRLFKRYDKFTRIVLLINATYFFAKEYIGILVTLFDVFEKSSF